MSHHIELTVPEERPSITTTRIFRIEVDVAVASARIYFEKIDSNGDVAGGGDVSFAVAGTDLNTFLAALVTTAQAGGYLPAGTLDTE